LDRLTQNCARAGGKVGFVGVAHGVQLDGQELFFAQKSLLGGPAQSAASCRKFFDLELPLADVAGYRAMEERRAIKTLLRVKLDVDVHSSSNGICHRT
jgi:threonine dehydrogenase-like Zn-dependent dehydrogenase